MSGFEENARLPPKIRGERARSNPGQRPGILKECKGLVEVSSTGHFGLGFCRGAQPTVSARGPAAWRLIR